MSKQLAFDQCIGNRRKIERDEFVAPAERIDDVFDERAFAGTFSGSLPKKRELTILVSVVRFLTPVLELNDVYGSLKAR